MTLEQLIEEKSFALYPCQGAPMVIRVDELIDWLMVESQRTDKAYLSAVVGL
jgi:hypothetical protein